MRDKAVSKGTIVDELVLNYSIKLRNEMRQNLTSNSVDLTWPKQFQRIVVIF